MKLLTIVAVLLLSSVAHSQTVVHKPVTLLKISGGMRPVEFQKSVVDSAASYQVMFRNIAYQELIDVKYLPIPKRYLSGFYNALADALVLAIGDKIAMPNYSIEKIRTGALGKVNYWLHYDNGYCQLSERDIKDLQSVIRKEL